MTCYATENTKSKKLLKDKVNAGELIGVVEMTPFGSRKKVGVVCICGPHYPAPHTWYAQITTNSEGYIVKVE